MIDPKKLLKFDQNIVYKRNILGIITEIDIKHNDKYYSVHVSNRSMSVFGIKNINEVPNIFNYILDIYNLQHVIFEDLQILHVKARPIFRFKSIDINDLPKTSIINKMSQGSTHIQINTTKGFIMLYPKKYNF
jgi:hypothetical protein